MRASKCEIPSKIDIDGNPILALNPQSYFGTHRETLESIVDVSRTVSPSKTNLFYEIKKKTF